MIKTQQLVPDSLDGCCSVSSELVYNNMNNAMTIFNTKLFRNENKSFYSNQDMIPLDEYRSVVPIGQLTNISEIDNEFLANIPIWHGIY